MKASRKNGAAPRRGNGPAPEIRTDPRNARLHGPENKAMIRASLEEVGAFRSIGIDGDGIVRAGNGVFEQAQSLGLKVRVIDAKADELVAVRRPDLKGSKAVRAALLDNRTGELSTWDPKVLGELNVAGMLQGLDMEEFVQKQEKPLVDSDTLLDQAVQLRPPREYIVVICAADDGTEFATLRQKLNLGQVRRGGYKAGSQNDQTGVQRVIHANDLLKRLK